jgi:hypothetical protein
MRDSLREALKETHRIKHDAIEEEVVTGIANIEKICTNALRQYGKAKGLSKSIVPTTKARH